MLVNVNLFRSLWIGLGLCEGGGGICVVKSPLFSQKMQVSAFSSISNPQDHVLFSFLVSSHCSHKSYHIPKSLFQQRKEISTPKITKYVVEQCENWRTPTLWLYTCLQGVSWREIRSQHPKLAQKSQIFQKMQNWSSLVTKMLWDVFSWINVVHISVQTVTKGEGEISSHSKEIRFERFCFKLNFLKEMSAESKYTSAVSSYAVGTIIHVKDEKILVAKFSTNFWNCSFFNLIWRTISNSNWSQIVTVGMNHYILSDCAWVMVIKHCD